jgi:hypothetical protein
MSKPKGTRSAFAARLNETERNQIVAWSREGVSQWEIGRRLRCDARTVRKWQLRLGCPMPQQPRPLDEEAQREIRAFAGSGLGYRDISRITGIGLVRTRVYMRAHGLSQKTGAQFLPKEKRVALEKSIRNRENFLYKIAKSHGVGVATASRYAKKVLGPGPLKGTWPPLQSKFSQLDAKDFVPTPQEYFLAIVRKCVDSAAGQLLRQGYDRAEVISAKRFLKHNPQPVLDVFEDGLREAVASHLAETTRAWTVH